MKQLRRFLGTGLPAAFLAALLLVLCAACSGWYEDDYDGEYGEDAGKFDMFVQSYGREESSAASADYYASEEAVAADVYADDMAEAVENPATAGGGSQSLLIPVSSERKIITTVTLRMESKEYDACVAAIYRAVEAFGGYVEYSDIAGSIREPQSTTPAAADGGLAVKPMYARDAYFDGYYGDTSGYIEGEPRYLYLRIRIPQTELGGFLEITEANGNVLSKQESAEDITLDYVDVESHKQALLAEQERLLALLEQAVDVEAMIALEQRLSDVRYQLQSYESRLRVMENQVSYSTVNLTLNEVVVYTERPPEPNPTVSQRISRGFVRTMKNIGDFWVDVFVGLMVNIVYIVGVLVVILIVVLLARRYLKKHPRVAAEGPIANMTAGDMEQEGGGVAVVKGAAPAPRRSLREWVSGLFVPPFGTLDKLVLAATIVHLFLAVGGPFVDEMYYNFDGFILIFLGFIACLYMLFCYISVLSVPLTVIALVRRFSIQHRAPEDKRAVFRGLGCWVLIVLNVIFALAAWSFVASSFF